MKKNKTCILFIHGIGSNTEDTWGDLKEVISYKKNTEKYSNIDFDFFNYQSQKIDGVDGFSKKALKKLFKIKDSESEDISQIGNFSKLLKTYLDKDKFLKYKKIFIIAHSMGGLITTRFILDEFSQGRATNIQRVLYICTPFQGSVFSDIAVHSGLASPEAYEMTINSNFLKKLISDVKDSEFEKKIDSSFFFGNQDIVIKNYSKAVKYGAQQTLEGNHTSILKKNNMTQNFEHIEKFFLEEKHQTFIKTIYSRACSNRRLLYRDNYIRKIKQPEAYKNFEQNYLETILLEDEDKKKYLNMMKLINNHYFSPHEIYQGKDYYVPIKQNEIALSNYWEEITTNNYVDPFLYIGSRGSGKTHLQNIWLNQHFKEMEEQKLIHVRCDVHKIYDLMHKNTNSSNHNLSIEEYLNMQLLYIYLKYRNKKFNNKGHNQEGVTSLLMREIDTQIDKNNKSIVKDSKFNTLGDFIDQMSENIRRTEVEIRKNDRKYSYAIELMENISSGKVNSEILNNYDELTNAIIKKGSFDKINNLLATAEKDVKKNALKAIHSTINRNINEDNDIQIADMNVTLLRISKILNAGKKNTTKLWIIVSKHIQKIMLSKNYKILKMIDGIDNIIIQDSKKDKRFYINKVKELKKIIYRENKPFLYYYISLRSDTFSLLQKKKEAKKTYETDGLCAIPLKCNIYKHKNVGLALNEVIKKRYNSLESMFSNEKKKTLYCQILSHVFNYKNEVINEITKINHIRMILRNCLFLSLHILFEFNRKKKHMFDASFCSFLIKERFNQSFFLRNKLYVYTGEVTGRVTENKYKVFPNLFYTYYSSGAWLGLCRIRILQLIGNKYLEKKEIIRKLRSLYPEEHIEKKVESLLSYNLTKTVFDKNSKTIKYKTAYKGKHLLDMVSKDLDVLYYLSLDTPLPSKYVNENDISYFSVFIKKEEYPDNTGYGNSIIKSVVTFILFIKYIHNKEISTLRENNVSKEELCDFHLPLNIDILEQKMIAIYKGAIADYSKLSAYFEYIGKYNTNELDSDLNTFSWHKN